MALLLPNIGAAMSILTAILGAQSLNMKELTALPYDHKNGKKGEK